MLVLLWLGACSSPNPARQGAEDFVDRYYVGVDPAAAREYAVGFARGKLDRELKLLEEVDMAEMSARPIVIIAFSRKDREAMSNIAASSSN